jgi:hypothetical protein
LNYEVKEDETGRACSTHVKKRAAYRVWWDSQKEKKPPGRSRCRWEDNIKTDLREIGRAVWTGLI